MSHVTSNSSHLVSCNKCLSHIRNYEALVAVNAQINSVNRYFCNRNSDLEQENSNLKQRLELKDAAMSAQANELANTRQALASARSLLARLVITDQTSLGEVVRRVQ